MSNLILPQTEIEYRNALIDAAEVGAAKAMIKVGALSPLIKKTTAEDIYSASIIRKLVKNGLVKLIKQGDRNHTVYLDRIELISAIKTFYQIK